MASEGSFRGENYYLSNFYEVPIEFQGIKYRSSEAAYQAQKCSTEEERIRFSQLSSAEAKRLRDSFKPRQCWDDEKIQIMVEIVRAKFRQNPDLAERLLATGDEPLVERNSWGDTFWGTDMDGNGENMLGRILMLIRKELMNER